MPRIHQEIPMQRLRLARVCTLLWLAVLALSGPAWAQGRRGGPAQEDTPLRRPAQELEVQYRWGHAATLFAEGTRLFKQWRFDEAEAKYREALAHVEHRLIRLYLSRALEKQGRLLEAHEVLQQALRPGVDPLPAQDVRVAEALQHSLESRLAQIEAHCDVPGTEVFLDGERWFTAPGRQRRIVEAGQHVLSARKPGYFPVTEAVSLLPGKPTHAVLRMTADVIHVERRWQFWQPRAVVGTGLAMSLAGGLLLLRTRNEHVAIQKQLDECARAAACAQLPYRRLDRSIWTERIGTGALITGGTFLAVGLAGVFLNLPRIRRSEPAGGVEILEIAPTLSPDTAGVSARLRF
jgi:tetratricopeptide (TPR) repeat protein